LKSKLKNVTNCCRCNGGRFCPDVNVLGAYEVAVDQDVEIILVGDEQKIKSFFKLIKKNIKGK